MTQGSDEAAERKTKRTKQKAPFVFPRVESKARPAESVYPLRYWTATYQSTQKYRIVGGNRLSAWDRQMDTAEPALSPQAMELHGTAERLEAIALGEIRGILKTVPIWTEWLSHVAGIDVTLGAALLSMLLPPRADKTVSSWYKAAGLNVVNATPQSLPPLGWEKDSEAAMDETVSDRILGTEVRLADIPLAAVLAELDSPAARKHPCELDPTAPHIPRLTKGEQPTWHPHLKRTCYLVAASFVRSGRYYRDFYDEWKWAYTRKHSTGRFAARAITVADALAYQAHRVAAQKPQEWPRWIAARCGVPAEVVGRDNRGRDVLDWEVVRAWDAQQWPGNALLRLRGMSRPWWDIDSVARWRTAKFFMAGMWTIWCAIDNIPCRPPYPITMLGHRADHYRLPPRPEDFDGKM